MSAPQANEAEKNIEIWKVKKLIKRLEAARGNGTSMISLIIRKSTVVGERGCSMLMCPPRSPEGSSFPSSADVGRRVRKQNNAPTG